MPLIKFFFVLLFSITTYQQDEHISIGKPFQSSVDWMQISADSLELLPDLGLVYYQKRPFTGTGITYFSNGFKAITIDYKNGKREGKYRKWFEEGLISFEASYSEGKRHGTTRSWWRNGNLRSEANYEMGIAQGVQQQWYASGAKFKRIHLLDGKEEGLQQSWRENGKLYNNYEAKNGRIFGLKRANLCYELNNEIVQYSSN